METVPETHTASFKEIAMDTVRYWEWRRLIYNGVLILIVCGTFLMSLPGSMNSANGLWAIKIKELFVLAIIANVFYCVAYIPDVFVQLSRIRDHWRKWRWILFVLGTALASLPTWALTALTFMPPELD